MPALQSRQADSDANPTSGTRVHRASLSESPQERRYTSYNEKCQQSRIITRERRTHQAAKQVNGCQTSASRVCAFGGRGNAQQIQHERPEGLRTTKVGPRNEFLTPQHKQEGVIISYEYKAGAHLETRNEGPATPNPMSRTQPETNSSQFAA